MWTDHYIRSAHPGVSRKCQEERENIQTVSCMPRGHHLAGGGKLPGSVLYMIKHCIVVKVKLYYLSVRNIYLHFYTYFIGNKMFVIIDFFNTIFPN